MPETELPELITVREKTACFTGHRPEKFPFKTDLPAIWKMFRAVLSLHIREAADAGYDTFISGMQRGMDIWAAKEVIALKAKYPSLRLYCVSPFEREIRSRKGEDRRDYEEVAAACDRFITLSADFRPDCYSIRNRYMVDRSSLVIAAAADKRSGTWQTVRYARRTNVNVDLIDLEEFAADYGLDRY